MRGHTKTRSNPIPTRLISIIVHTSIPVRHQPSQTEAVAKTSQRQTKLGEIVTITNLNPNLNPTPNPSAVSSSCDLCKNFLTKRAIPKRLRDVSCTGATQIDITFTFTFTFEGPASVTCAVRAPAPGRLVGSRLKLNPLGFLAGCRKRRLNQALSVLRLSLCFFCVC